jgi:hypothetical protein
LHDFVRQPTIVNYFVRDRALLRTSGNMSSWSDFAYAISWQTPSRACACLISDRHKAQFADENVTLTRILGREDA